VIGPDFSSKKRTPTVSFVHNDFSPHEVCKKLASKNICAWDGHFYALKAIQKLGLESKGGVTRLGVSVYNTKQEIDKVIEVISEI
jgi:selenocysteine lyase/cysteine desulfurase